MPIAQEQIKLNGYAAAGNISPVGMYVWNTGSLAWEKQTPIGASGGGAVTLADGADVAEGTRADAAYVTGSGTVVAILKGIFGKFGTLGQKVMAGSTPVAIASDQSALPITAAALPLPAGAASAALQTQPGVDIGDVTINNAGGANAVNIQDGGNSITVDGTVTTAPPANATENITQFGGTNISTGPGASGAGMPRLTTTNDSQMRLLDSAGADLTSAKAAQSARFLGVQSALDAGRQFITFTAVAAAGVVAEALFALGQNKAGTVTAGVTSYVVTNGKTFRFQSITWSVRAAAAAVPFSRVIIRSNTAGATVVGSNVLFDAGECFGIAAVIGVGGQMTINLPDGLEIVGNGTISFGVAHLDQAITNIINLTVCGFEY